MTLALVGSDGVLHPVPAQAQTDPVPGFTVTPTGLVLEEGGSATYTVVLNSQPWDGVAYVDGEFIGEEDFEGDVLVHTYSGGEEITIRPVALIFDRDNWNVPQTVTVTSHHDLDGIDEPVVTILHFLDMNHFSETDDPDYVLQTFDVRVTVTGDDRPGVSVSEASLDIDGGDPVGRGAAAVSFEHKPHGGQARVEGPHQEAAPQERPEGRHPHADGCGSGRHAGPISKGTPGPKDARLCPG